ncbi:hypothetical protein GEMRC1_013757 [Eukaryota sp. GEM-RC1]
MNHKTKKSATLTSSGQRRDRPRRSLKSKAGRNPNASTSRPDHEEYELPSEAPFTAKLVNVAPSTTEADIKRAFSSLSVTTVRSSRKIPGTFFVKFHDVQGLKQCLDKFWMFKIHDRPIRTYVASAPQSSVKPLNVRVLSSKPNAKPLELLPLTSSFQSPLRNVDCQQSLLILIHIHLLRRLCKSFLECKRDESCRDFLCLKQHVSNFFTKVGFVSHRFFESAILSTKVFFGNKHVSFSLL